MCEVINHMYYIMYPRRRIANSDCLSLSLSLSIHYSLIDSYIPWNYHEPEEGQYDFEGQRDFVQFIKQAQEVGLLVLLRAGPYICGEWDFVSVLLVGI